MARYWKIFPKGQLATIGMVHVRALPGTPASGGHTVEDLVEIACREASIYKRHRLSGICLENMFDRPYVTRKDAGPETVSIITRIACEVRRIVKDVPIGVQLLAGLNLEAIAVATAARLDFIRAEAFVFAHVADEGWLDGCAGQLLRYRKTLGPEAEKVAVLTDIKKKHSAHAVTGDVSLVDTAKAANFFQSDGLIITGKETGDEPCRDEVSLLCKTFGGKTPIILGSGVTADNVAHFQQLGIDAAIVGSYFKLDGHWANDIDEMRVAKFMENVQK